MTQVMIPHIGDDRVFLRSSSDLGGGLKWRTNRPVSIAELFYHDMVLDEPIRKSPKLERSLSERDVDRLEVKRDVKTIYEIDSIQELKQLCSESFLEYEIELNAVLELKQYMMSDETFETKYGGWPGLKDVPKSTISERLEAFYEVCWGKNPEAQLLKIVTYFGAFPTSLLLNEKLEGCINERSLAAFEQFEIGKQDEIYVLQDPKRYDLVHEATLIPPHILELIAAKGVQINFSLFSAIEVPIEKMKIMGIERA